MDNLTAHWYLSCPHGCSDPETCPYGRKHLVNIRALLQELAEKKERIDDLKAELSRQAMIANQADSRG